jgi:hypothetical protein
MLKQPPAGWQRRLTIYLALCAVGAIAGTVLYYIIH